MSVSFIARPRLRSGMLTFTKSVTKAPWGAFAMFADPDGNEFWINEA